MAQVADASEWIGEFRAPRNPHSEAKGSIHDDATATKLGFKGGTVAGSIHMDQFVPALLETFGERWWRDGSISLYFTQATTDGEKVRVVVDTSAPQAKLRMYNEAGDQICEGTAAVGPDPDSELCKRILKQPEADPATLRVLKDVRVGDEAADVPMTVTREQLAGTLSVITETVPAYADGVLPPSNAIRLSHQARGAVLEKAAKPSVGLFGALEVEHLKGPLKAGADYVARTRVLRLGESPKTENVWYDVTVSDPETGDDVARVRYLIRIMKGSSPLYRES
jgi:hypothetical protein